LQICAEDRFGRVSKKNQWLAFLARRQRLPGVVTAKATSSDSLYEAIFYVGEWHLLRKETIDATQKFKAALLSCLASFMEHDGAEGELFRLRRN
jgi:lipoprotein NlpI